MRTLTLAETAAFTRAKPRAIQHWTTNDVIRCEADTKHSGTGTPRLYSQVEVAIATVLARLSYISLPIGELKEISEAVRGIYAELKIFSVDDLLQRMREAEDCIHPFEDEVEQIRRRRDAIAAKYTAIAGGDQGGVASYVLKKSMYASENYQEVRKEEEAAFAKLQAERKKIMRPLMRCFDFFSAIFPGELRRKLAGQEFERDWQFYDRLYLIIQRSNEIGWRAEVDIKEGEREHLKDEGEIDWGVVFYVNITTNLRGLE